MSSGIVIAALLTYGSWLDKRHPLPATPTAGTVGMTWTTLTVLFEFALGRERGVSSPKVTADNNLAQGRLWPLVLASIRIALTTARALHRPR